MYCVHSRFFPSPEVSPTVSANVHCRHKGFKIVVFSLKNHGTYTIKIMTVSTYIFCLSNNCRSNLLSFLLDFHWIFTYLPLHEENHQLGTWSIVLMMIAVTVEMMIWNLFFGKRTADICICSSVKANC